MSRYLGFAHILRVPIDRPTDRPTVAKLVYKSHRIKSKPFLASTIQSPIGSTRVLLLSSHRVYSMCIWQDCGRQVESVRANRPRAEKSSLVTLLYRLGWSLTGFSWSNKKEKDRL